MPVSARIERKSLAPPPHRPADREVPQEREAWGQWRQGHCDGVCECMYVSYGCAFASFFPCLAPSLSLPPFLTPSLSLPLCTSKLHVCVPLCKTPSLFANKNTCAQKMLIRGVQGLHRPEGKCLILALIMSGLVSELDRLPASHQQMNPRKCTHTPPDAAGKEAPPLRSTLQPSCNSRYRVAATR